MRNYLLYIAIAGAILVSNNSYSQTAFTAIDSMKAESYLNGIQTLSASESYDDALLLTNQAIDFYDSLNLQPYKFSALIEKGAIYRERGDYIEALTIFNQILDEFTDSSYNIAYLLNHIGAVHRQRGNYAAALDTYYKALRLIQASESKTGLSSVYNNIGVVLLYQKDYNKSLEYYKLALDLYKQNNDIEGIGVANLNIGEVYRKKKDYDNARNYYLNALVYAKQINDLDAIGTIYNEIAGINIELNKLDDVPQYLKMSMDVFTKLNSSLRIAECEITYGNYYVTISQYPKAIEHYSKSLKIAKNTQLLEIQSIVTSKLSDVYEKMGNSTQALKLYKNHIVLRDSIYNNENTRKSVEAELFYKFDGKQEKLRIEQAKNDAIFQEKSNRQKITRNFLFLVIFLMLFIIVGSFITIRRNKKITTSLRLHQYQIQEQNEELQQKQEEIIAQRDEIERNNEILEKSQRIISEKNYRMISSIEYAQTIQKALLPSEELLSTIFTDHFVVYKPKDIVSGDFYWVNAQSDYIEIAVMDCTGHGVPGAFMSLIGNTLLNQIVKEWQIHNPAVILDNLDEMLMKLLQPEGNKIPIRSSIDIGFLSINKKKHRAAYAGANRPLLYINNGIITKLQGSVRSVGEIQKNNSSYFKIDEIDIVPNTSFYLTTDGYTDQMNDDHRKYGQRNLHKLLQGIYLKPMCQQREILINTFDNYKGSEEQIDDVCLIGVRL